MATDVTHSVADAARRIYETSLRSVLEASHLSEFVAIEPVSGEYFLGQSLSAAIGAARQKHPDRMSHAIRIGHKAAVEFGRKLR